MAESHREDKLTLRRSRLIAAWCSGDGQAESGPGVLVRRPTTLSPRQGPHKKPRSTTPVQRDGVHALGRSKILNRTKAKKIPEALRWLKFISKTWGCQDSTHQLQSQTRQACQALSPCLAPAPAGRAAPAGKAPSAEAACGRQQARPVPAVSLGLRCPRPGVGIGRPRPVPQSAATASQLLKDGQAQNGTVRHVHEPSARLANHGGCGKAGRSHGVRKAPTCRQSER